jgi:hypothetical protein
MDCESTESRARRGKMLQNTPVAWQRRADTGWREGLNLAQGLDSGRTRPRAHRCTDLNTARDRVDGAWSLE